MKVALYLDTSILGFSFALKEMSDEGRILHTFYGKSGRGSSFQLSKLLDEKLKELGLDSKAVSSVVVSRGPGSFTGIRLGLSWAEGFCLPSSRPLVGFSSLEALVLSLAKEKSLDACSFLLGNTKTTGFMASYEKGQVSLSFVDEKSSYDVSVLGPLFMDDFYEGPLTEKASESFPKERIAQMSLESLLLEVDLKKEKFFDSEAYPATPLYLRKSSVEERLAK